MAIEIKNLLLQRDSFVLDVSSLQITDGEIVSLVGPSGSGKSSLLLALAGFHRIDRGQITDRNGIRMEELPPERREMGLLFQKAALFPHLTVLENVEFGLRVRGVLRKERRLRALAGLERVRIAELAGRKPSELSGGQMQRVALARVLVIGFRVLLLDEPFSSLDPPLRKDLRLLVSEVVKENKISTVLVTHDPVDVRALSRRVVVLRSGAIEYDGDASTGGLASDWLRLFME